MKIIVFSDNHGKVERLVDVRKRHPEIQFFIHCGDYCSDIKTEWMIRVAGNNDYDGTEDIKIIKIEGVRIFITHGHLFSRFNLEKNLVKEAKKYQCDIVCFGHIHTRVCEWVDRVLVINPGSISYNYDGTLPGYAILDLQDKSVEFKVF